MYRSPGQSICWHTLGYMSINEIIVHSYQMVPMIFLSKDKMCSKRHFFSFKFFQIFFYCLLLFNFLFIYVKNIFVRTNENNCSSFLSVQLNCRKFGVHSWDLIARLTLAQPENKNFNICHHQVCADLQLSCILKHTL
jgi:hypothetical protein